MGWVEQQQAIYVSRDYVGELCLRAGCAFVVKTDNASVPIECSKWPIAVNAKAALESIEGCRRVRVNGKNGTMTLNGFTPKG